MATEQIESNSDQEIERQPETWQERIVRWRYESNSTPKRIIGFWLKAGIEVIIIIGIPMGLFIFTTTTLVDFTLSTLPILPTALESKTIAWSILTAGSWLSLRCMLTEELELVNAQ
ncbi:hypothetical protein ACFOZ7_05695 [Natribaculum luteum]|uniref:CPBP family intramembrane metalloprotease n=1 Tax=Natribaculum luteum TaxID=1586232 RepID=A0ABD5NWV4_9EURY|nr:hypothetical protein [Natribaculum luteum]